MLLCFAKIIFKKVTTTTHVYNKLLKVNELLDIKTLFKSTFVKIYPYIFIETLTIIL
jgi:hypothetical protein